MRLRNVEPEDVGAYVRMRCDPVMMADLGGPLPVEGIADKVRRDAEAAAADRSWIKMIVPDGVAPGEVAGCVMLWSQEEDGTAYSEIGWMVLPEFQGRGLGKAAVRTVLDEAVRDGRWGAVHAHPAVTNGPSNGICHTLGFRLAGEREVDFAGRLLRVNHWVLDPGHGAPGGAPRP
ncbi:GNAT family N-acetyltransferase [Streptomyces sp. CB01881]|uniref:GNAT family N-acetyltransferase n=1 Tax=Streptomyces sp. CB01881 TaxID=2078691 RepID=UPI000CDC459E|nr:GNAT family N-acetyltransferase [Streptomyces sp. CB01881]AUY51096.1 GNAT family N-acetyltransferase [Streptomyces sp. CB01881]TYC74479.1 N-acetyltransferase [Streptomyces sp. CB01881]